MLSSSIVCPDEVQVLPAAGNSFVHGAEGTGPCRKGGVYCQLGIMGELTPSSLHVSKKISVLHSRSRGEGVASSLDTPQVCQRKERGEPLREQFLTENPLQSLQGQPASCPVFQLARPGRHCPHLQSHEAELRSRLRWTGQSLYCRLWRHVCLWPCTCEVTLPQAPGPLLGETLLCLDRIWGKTQTE